MFKPLFLALLLWSFGVHAVEDADQRMGRLARLSIEDLISLKVVSVSKKEERQSQTAAAIQVITGEDIRRAGASTFTDALRLAAGVHVAAVGSNLRAVGIRGFNDLHTNKLLVLVDGRTIYNHLFSGVFWPQYQLFLEDIDRIEVIRGPGSTLWGSNAVNGVINVITKKADQTTGNLLTLGAGELAKSHAGFRHGGELAKGAWRIHAKTMTREDDSSGFTNQDLADESSRFTHLDTRVDLNLTQKDQLTLTAGGFKTKESNANRPRDLEDEELYLVTHYQRLRADGGTASAKLSYERMVRQDQFAYDVMDLELQTGRLVGAHDLVYGMGYRIISDKVNGGIVGNAVFDPVRDNHERGNFFVQDKWSLRGNTDLILGSKFEYNEDTHLEVQPNLRLFHQMSGAREQSLWLAVSRAARIPSRVELDGALLGPLLVGGGGGNQPGGGAGGGPGGGPGGGGGPPPRPMIPPLYGNRDFDTSTVTAFEAGYRVQAAANLFLDMAAFYNQYNDLEALEVQADQLLLINGLEGHTRGLELALDWRPRPWWRLALSMSGMDINLRPMDVDVPLLDTASHIRAVNPQFTAVLRSNMNPLQNLEVDVIVRHVDQVRQSALPFPQVLPQTTIDAYTTFDIHLAWRLNHALDVALVGRDLTAEHAEYTAYQLGPNGFFKLAWRF